MRRKTVEIHNPSIQWRVKSSCQASEVWGILVIGVVKLTSSTYTLEEGKR